MSRLCINTCFLVLAFVALVVFLIWGALSVKDEEKNDGDPRLDEIKEEEDEDEDEYEDEVY